MTKRIVYVDDEADIREIAAMSLQLNPEFEVRVAGSGKEALELVRSWKPDIVLLDVMMPEMDGPMTLEKLRGTDGMSDVPVVFVTAKTQPGEVEKLTSLDVAGFIAKPFDPMTLADQVAGILNASTSA